MPEVYLRIPTVRRDSEMSGSRNNRTTSVLSGQSSGSGGTNNPSGSNMSASGVSVTNIPDDSFRFAAFEPPELLFNVSSRTCDDRSREFHEHKLVLEDRNASLVSVIARRFTLLKLADLCKSKVPGIENCPLNSYLSAENFQLVHKISTYFISCLEPAEHNLSKESHAVTNFRFNEHSDNFDIPTTKSGASYYIMMKEDVLVDSMNEFSQMSLADFGSEGELKKTVKFLFLSLRCNLINKFFVTEFLKKQTYSRLLKFLCDKKLIGCPEILLECVQVLRVILSRSLKYNSDVHLKQTNKLKPRNSRQSDSLDDGIYTEEDEEVFEKFKSDRNFWISLVDLLVWTQSDENFFSQVWCKGDAYPIVDLLTMVVTLTSNDNKKTPHLSEAAVCEIFSAINASFDKLLEVNGELPLSYAVPRDSGFGEESQLEKDEVIKGLVSDKKLTMCLLLIKLAIKTTDAYMMKFKSPHPSQGSATTVSSDRVLSAFQEFVRQNRITQLLFRSEFKTQPDILYPYTEYAYLRKNKRSGSGSGGGPDQKISQLKLMHTRCHRIITKIYQLCFTHFYSDDILHTIDTAAVIRQREELMSLFKRNSDSSDQNASASETRIAHILDVEFLKDESEVARKVHVLAVKYFLNNAGHHVLAKLSSKNSTIVPLVKAAFYTTNFVLKLLHMDRYKLSCLKSNKNGPQISTASEVTIKNASECLLYSYFFSLQSIPDSKDLYELIMRLLINFVNTFLYGRPTNAEKHFYKVIRFERMAIERTCHLIAVRWASPTNAKQTPNSREFQEKIVYEKAIEMPTTSSSDYPKMEKIREQCRLEATKIWEAQCLNHFSSNSNNFYVPCKYRDTQQNTTSKDFFIDGSISFQLSSDKSKIEYKISPRDKDKRGSIIENSAFIKSCKFVLTMPKETTANLRIDLEQAVAPMQQQIQPDQNDNSASLPFPITLEEKQTDGDISILYFAECIKIILTSSNLSDRFETNVNRNDLEKCSQKLGNRRTLENSIEDLLYKTRTFPLICLPLDKKTSSPPELPPLPKCLPLEQCTEL